MRFQGKSRLGSYPLPLSEAQRIRRFRWFPVAPSSAIDPCVGDGVAFEIITSGARMLHNTKASPRPSSAATMAAQLGSFQS